MTSKQQCVRALDLHESSLGACKNVVGMGIVEVDDEKASGKTNAVAVYVSRKLPEAELDSRDIIPRYLEIPGRGKPAKIRTKVIEQGEVSLETIDGDSP